MLSCPFPTPTFAEGEQKFATGRFNLSQIFRSRRRYILKEPVYVPCATTLLYIFFPGCPLSLSLSFSREYIPFVIKAEAFPAFNSQQRLRLGARLSLHIHYTSRARPRFNLNCATNMIRAGVTWCCAAVSRRERGNRRPQSQDASLFNHD